MARTKAFPVQASETPHSIEAEQSVLGGLMIDNRVFADVSQRLRAEDFYRKDHQLIYRAIGEVMGTGKPCDFVTLSEHLRSQGRLEEAGGIPYLGSLAVDTYSVTNVLHYADIVLERSRLRQLIEIGKAITAMAFRPEGRSVGELAEVAEEKLDTLLVALAGTEEGASNQQDELHPTIADLLKHYVLIYGTETVWDERQGRIIGLSALRVAAGGDRVQKWLKHPQRREVHTDHVVFEPAWADPVPGYVNMFGGLPIKPHPGECDLILQLLEHLCSTEDGSEEKPLLDWVLKWLAYPLQHLGAKMQTAVLFHGLPGAGKNLMFKILRAIYGEYYTEIGQAQLEFFRFNGWGSRKLMVLGNEVISRTELKHSEGQLRQWITEPTWQVDEKNLPLREETNHANFIFLSNFVVPLSLGRRDRRMAVLYTPRDPLKEDLAKRIDAQISNGGIAAFYHYLLDLELGDFTEHTKPPMTQAKQQLLDASAESYERFEAKWLAGELPVPFMACLSLDLYKAYRKFCEERGERNPARDALFVAAISKAVRHVKKKYTVQDNDEFGRARVSEGMVFLPPEWGKAEGKNEQQTLGQCISHFRQLLGEWSRDPEAKGGESTGEGYRQ